MFIYYFKMRTTLCIVNFLVNEFFLHVDLSKSKFQRAVFKLILVDTHGFRLRKYKVVKIL